MPLPTVQLKFCHRHLLVILENYKVCCWFTLDWEILNRKASQAETLAESFKRERPHSYSPHNASLQSQLIPTHWIIPSWEYLGFYRGAAINRCADAHNPRPRCARSPPLAINRSQRVVLINRALNYCISRHNNEVSSFRKKYGHHVGGRRGRNKSLQIIAYECV